MKMKKWILAGAAVLLASVVVIGCKTGVEGGGSEKWTVVEKDYVFKFNDTNTSDKSQRGYKQFGHSLTGKDKVTAAIIKVEAKRPQDGVSGGLLGLTKNSDDSLNFFVCGVKTVNNQPRFFVSWHNNVTEDQINSGSALPGETPMIPNSSEGLGPVAGDTTYAAVPSTAGLSVAADGSLTFYLSFVQTKTGDAADGFNAFISATAPNFTDLMGGNVQNGMKLTVPASVTDYKYLGGIAAYGTTFPGTGVSGGVTNSETTFTVMNVAVDGKEDKPSSLSAE